MSDLVLWRALLLPLLPLFDFLGKGEMVRLAEGVRVPQTVELRCFFRPFRWSPAHLFLGWSTVLVGGYMVLLSFPRRLVCCRFSVAGACARRQGAGFVNHNKPFRWWRSWLYLSRAVLVRSAFWWSSWLYLSSIGSIACRGSWLFLLQ